MKLWNMDPPNAEWFGTSKVSVLNKFDLDFYIDPTLRMKITVDFSKELSKYQFTAYGLYYKQVISFMTKIAIILIASISWY